MASDFLVYSHTVGIAAMEGRGFYFPVDAALTSDGKMHVVNRALESMLNAIRVTICNADSEFFGNYGSYGTGDGQFMWPTSIAVDSQDNTYVADEYTHTISVFTKDGEFVSKWGKFGSAPGMMNAPSGIAFDKKDSLYVVDHRNDRIQCFTKNGSLVSSFGKSGDNPGEFRLPWGITVAPDGAIWVADWGNNRVQAFSPDGHVLRVIGTEGRAIGELTQPSSVAVDDGGFVYVTDWGNERLQVFSQEGHFVAKYRGEATESKWANDFLTANVEEARARLTANMNPDISAFKDDPFEESSHVESFFWGPTSVTTDMNGKVFVTESNRHRIQVYLRGEQAR